MATFLSKRPRRQANNRVSASTAHCPPGSPASLCRGIGACLALLAGMATLGASVVWADASMTPLKPGQRVAGYDARKHTDPYIVQRLTEHVYWVAVDSFNSTVVVGEEGVLVIDPLSEGRAERLLAAVASISDLPVTALIYSHSHMDHISDAPDFVAKVTASGRPLRILATDKTVQQIAYYSKDVPAPTEVIATPVGAFEFEGMAWRVHTPPEYGHSIDSSIFHFAAEQFAHCTDMVEPGNLPFLNFNSAMSVRSFAGAVQSLLELDWRHLNGGHGNVGNRADAEFYLEYTEDITAAALQAMQAVDFTKFIDPEDHPIGALVNWSQAVSDQVLATMQAKYGARKDLKHLMLGHVQALIRDGVLHGEGAYQFSSTQGKAAE